mgnify:CR=1 FL=1
MSFVKNTFAAIGVATVSVLAIGMIAGDKITQALENARQKCNEYDDEYNDEFDMMGFDDDDDDDDDDFDDCAVTNCSECGSRDDCPFWENDWTTLRYVIENANDDELTEILAMVDSARMDLETAHQKKEEAASIRSNLQAVEKKAEVLEKSAAEQPAANMKKSVPADDSIQQPKAVAAEVKEKRNSVPPVNATQNEKPVN